ncbi:MAG: AMP-binding protein [Coriobacteriales bacterium]|nr:AMP-binding protein [Coriobacteriales bacterium]
MDKKIEAQLVKSYIDRGYWKDRTLGDFVHNCANLWPQKIALIDAERSLTYQELDKATSCVAGYLAQLGVRKGDRVVLQLKNSIWHTVTFLGIAKAGAIPIMALCAHRSRELVSFAQRAEAVAMIVNDVHQGFDYPFLARKVQDQVSGVRHVLTLADIIRVVHSTEPLSLEQYLDRRPSFTDIGILTCSGGSTSIPKLIPRRHADYLYDAETFAAFLGLKQTDVFLVALPASHNFVLGNPGVLGTLSVGGTIVMCENPSPDEILPLIDEHRVTATALVPSILSVLLDILTWEDEYDLSCLRILLIGGAVFEEQLARRTMRELPGCLHQVFGTAEGINFSTAASDPEDVVACCQGRAISEADEWRIVDEDLREVPKGESGELIARGPYTIREYYRAPETEDSFTEDGFYRTGDKAHVSPQGYLVVEGRVNEQINRGGEKIMPSEMEGLLASYPGVYEVQVVGVSNELLGQHVCAYVMGCFDRIPTPAQINAYLSDLGVSAHKRVDQVEDIDEWPFTGVGKIDRRRLCEWAHAINVD